MKCDLLRVIRERWDIFVILEETCKNRGNAVSENMFQRQTILPRLALIGFGTAPMPFSCDTALQI